MKFLGIMAILIFIASPPSVQAGKGCTAKECHGGIRDIVPRDLPMMALIKQTGSRYGDMDGCVVCHGGNPSARKKQKAHKGIPPGLKRAPGPKAFYPDPGSIWVAQSTCGVCHAGYVYRVKRSLMNTEAGKIQGNLSTWGVDQTRKVVRGNHDIEDRDGPVPSGTFPAYESYIKAMKQKFPDQFPDRLKQIETASIQEVEKNPSKAALTYQRRECQRCHLGVKGRQIRGDYRGIGCSACHMPYGTDGLYRGKDPSIPKDMPGHVKTHRIAGNRKTNGIPVATCQSCHNRGKRIGTSFSGVMESPFSGPFDPKGNPQPLTHDKTYTPVLEDLHHRTQSREGNPDGGLLCQDCHTSMDVHGDGNIAGTTLAQVEIECTDCHGTPAHYPWELPLGHGDEFGRKLDGNPPRGLAGTRLMSGQQFGFDYASQDGYILSSRGNPLGNVVRTESRVLVHSATGKDFFVPVLKNLGKPWKNRSAAVAMSGVPKHMDRMECYACHGVWAPQCYGCHIKMDYSAPKARGIDWVASSNPTAEQGKPITIPGQISEETGYMRWEDPVLGINGEGRVSPLMPGCQVVYTVIGKNGNVLVQNRSAKNPVEASSTGQAHIPMALDMAPAQPHTASPRARSCESCHNRPKTLGLGINSGIFKTNPNIDGLTFDWSRIVTQAGVQLATVGTHWPASRAFNREELGRITRTGLCMGCHQFQADPDIWAKVSSEPSLDTKAHTRLMEKMIQHFSQRKK